MGRVSLLDAIEWSCKLRKKKINQFEFRDLPNELKSRALLRKAKEEGLIRKLSKKDNGKITWGLSDNFKCKDSVTIDNNLVKNNNLVVDLRNHENNKLEYAQ